MGAQAGCTQACDSCPIICDLGTINVGNNVDVTIKVASGFKLVRHSGHLLLQLLNANPSSCVQTTYTATASAFSVFSPPRLDENGAVATHDTLVEVIYRVGAQRALVWLTPRFLGARGPGDAVHGCHTEPRGGRIRHYLFIHHVGEHNLALLFGGHGLCPARSDIRRG